MNAKDFFYLVAEMRKAQKEYFLYRTQDKLTAAKNFEKKIDDEIERVNKIMISKER